MILAILSMSAIIILSLYLFLLKRDIKKMNDQFQTIESERNQLIELNLVDSSLNSLAESINNQLLNQKSIRIASVRRESELKETISNISHDLRTPLTAIVGYLQLLEREDLSEKQQEYIQIILEKALVMRDLTHSFFELSYYESKEVESDLEQINLSHLLIDEILRETASFEKKSIVPEIDIQEDCWVYADKKFLTRIIQNILANILQHGEDTAQFTLFKNEKTILKISNHYDPSLEIDSSRLFDRFYTSDGSRSGKGNGLGLSIVKLLAEKLNTTVSATAEEGLFTIQVEFEN